jgi:hypothetical protein
MEPIRKFAAQFQSLYSQRPDDQNGGELVGVGAPKAPKPNIGGAEASPPAPERRTQPARVEPRSPRKR